MVRLSWQTRIHRAEREHGFQDDDRIASGDWALCAVGEHRGLKPDDIYMGERLSVEEKRLGTEFEGAVKADDFAGAQRILDEIRTLPIPNMGMAIMMKRLGR